MSVSGIKASHRVEIVKLTIQGEKIGLLNQLLEAMGDNNINIWFVAQVRTRDDIVNITLCVDPSAVEDAAAVINDLSPGTELNAFLSGTILSVFPYRENAETAFRFFKALDGVDVPVLAVSTSLSSLSCLVPHNQAQLAQDALEEAFGLKRPV